MVPSCCDAGSRREAPVPALTKAINPSSRVCNGHRAFPIAVPGRISAGCFICIFLRPEGSWSLTCTIQAGEIPAWSPVTGESDGPAANPRHVLSSLVAV